jgi:FlaA1/EpsC-like NDP-sugar epimerase
VTGLRPAEKLHEELLIGNNPLPTSHPRIMKAHEDFLHWSEMVQCLQTLVVLLDADELPAVLELLQQVVSGYRPEGALVDWVHTERGQESTMGALARA